MRNQKSKDTYLYSDSRLANASRGYPFKFYEHGLGWPKAQKLAKKRAYEYGIQEARIAERNRQRARFFARNKLSPTGSSGFNNPVLPGEVILNTGCTPIETTTLLDATHGRRHYVIGQRK